jgi:hypothetical protein
LRGHHQQLDRFADSIEVFGQLHHVATKNHYPDLSELPRHPSVIEGCHEFLIGFREQSFHHAMPRR